MTKSGLLLGSLQANLALESGITKGMKALGFLIIWGLFFSLSLEAASTCESLFVAPGSHQVIKEQASDLRAKEYSRNSRLLALNWFVTSRGMNEYSAEFTNHKSTDLSFREKVNRLGPRGRWLDAGAGRANAQREFLETVPNFNDAPELVALAYKKPFFVGIPKGSKMKYLSGRMIEEIPDQELGTFDIISDYFGPTSYAKDSISVMNKYLRMIRDQGEIFISLPMFATVFRSQNGEVVSLGRWLREQLELSGDFEAELYHGQVLHVKCLNKSGYQLPELQQTRFTSDSPPSRTYQE